MPTSMPEPLIIGTGALSIILSLILTFLLATRRAHIKDDAGAQCLRFTLRTSNEMCLLRKLRETPHEEWSQLTRGFGVSLDWCGCLHLDDNAYILLSERYYQSIGLLIAMALVAKTSKPYPRCKQSRLGKQYAKTLRQAGVREQGLTSIEEALRKFLPTWQITLSANPPPS